MLPWLRTLIWGVETQPIILSFAMGMDEAGKNIVFVRRAVDGKWKVIPDIRKYWSYGYREEVDEKEGKNIYVLKEEDRQTLMALKSLNPQLRADGALVFEIEPTVLKYLRKKENLKEFSLAKQIQICESPIQPTAKISFDPQKGMEIETGYSLEGDEKVHRPEELKYWKDGKYARVGNIFTPLKELSVKAKELISSPVTYILPKDIPEFILRDLVMIKKEFNAVLTDLAKQVRVITAPLEPVIRVSKSKMGWLDFNVSYAAQGIELPHKLLMEKKGQPYVQLDDKTWVKVDPNIPLRTEKELEDIGAVLTENGYRLPAYEFATLEEFIKEIGGRPELTKAYQEFIQQLTSFEANENFGLPDPMEVNLKNHGFIMRPYQRSGIHWLNWLRANHLHGVLADDMGLGKTLESLCALRLGYEQTKTQQHSLVIAPKSVLIQWEREIKRVYPEMRLYIYHGSN